MNHILQLISVITLILWTIPAPAHSSGDPQKLPRGSWIVLLDLDNEQQEKLRALWLKKRETVDDLREEVRLKRKEIKQIIAGEGSPDKARAVHKKLQALQSELGNIDLESMLAIRELLTPQQRIKFTKIMSDRGKFGEVKAP